MPPLFRPADHGRKNVNLAGDATKITAEDATIAATAGDANLSNAAVAAGSFEASATQNLTAENLAVTVGTDETGAAGDVTITATTGDVALTDAKLTGTEGGVGDVAVSAGGNAQLDGLMKAENVALETGGFTADSAVIRAEETVSIAASDDVTLSGDTLVTADESVGIAMTGAVTVGDETTDENEASVTLTAKGDVMQSVTTGDGGLRGSDLTVASNEGAVDLGAGRDESIGSQGNAFDRITVEAAEDVNLATSGRDTEIAVNEKQNGTVNGDLTVIGEESGLTFTDDLSVKGDAVIQGASVKGEGLEAEGTVGILTALDDGEREPEESSGVEFTGPISGTQVTVITGEGCISLDRVTSTEGSTDIYRVGDESVADVTVGEVDSATSVTIFNNRGDNVLNGSVHGKDNVFALTGDEGSTSGSHHLDSSDGVAAAIGGMGEFADQVVENLPSGSGSGAWRPTELPKISLDTLMSGANHAVHAEPLRVQWTPADEFFFLNMRSDAEASKAESDEEEESPALEKGLPARIEPVITDHRKVTPQTLEELGLILSRR